MEILSFLAHLLSGATLLLFAVRFLRIGIERLWSARIRRSLSGTTSAVSLLAKGAGLGFLMQGATVVMLMAAGLAGSGTIPLISAALLAVGADFGSALVVQFLTLPVGATGPLAILVGGWLYLNAAEPDRRNFGRILLGLGLVFLSLSLIRQAVVPLQQFQGTTAILAYLDGDAVTAALLGLVLTLAMHSSLAAVLTALAFASHGELGMTAGLGFVIGCNIGSALLPVWLLRGDASAAGSVAKSVALLRIALAVACLGILSLPGLDPAALIGLSVERAVLLGHLGFNALLLLLSPALPAILRLFPLAEPGEEDQPFLLPEDEDDPRILAAALKGQVNRMLDLLAQMFEAATGEAGNLAGIEALETRLNRALMRLREAYARLPEMDEADGCDIRQIMDFAIRIEASGDLLSGKYAVIRREAERGDFVFTEPGKREIATLVNQVRRGIVLAQHVFWSDDRAAARELVLHKQ
ncbi:MAG: Na/Pi cotransporter family protein, partial [Paracoccus sp. (in: a-proteobacteria)]